METGFTKVFSSWIRGTKLKQHNWVKDPNRTNKRQNTWKLNHQEPWTFNKKRRGYLHNQKENKRHCTEPWLVFSVSVCSSVWVSLRVWQGWRKAASTTTPSMPLLTWGLIFTVAPYASSPLYLLHEIHVLKVLIHVFPDSSYSKQEQNSHLIIEATWIGVPKSFHVAHK